jgi:hypothetical protein
MEESKAAEDINSTAKASSRTPREIKEVEGGFYDKFGFYTLPNGGKFRNLPKF